MRVALAILSLLIALVAALPQRATAGGGNYVFDGGSPAEQAEVVQALEASAFNWDLVPGQIVVHVRRGLPTSFSLPGQIFLDADLLHAGQFSWGVPQMEYGQQVQFFLVDPSARRELIAALHAKSWCYEK